MATQHNVQEILTTAGNPCYVEVANRDAAGNVINTTYGALGGNNTWTGTNAFNGNVTFDGTVHSDLSFDSATGFTLGGDNTGYFGTNFKVNGNVLTLPSTAGTLALTTNIPDLLSSSNTWTSSNTFNQAVNLDNGALFYSPSGDKTVSLLTQADDQITASSVQVALPGSTGVLALQSDIPVKAGSVLQINW